MKTLVAVMLFAVIVTPAFAGESLQIYGGGPKVASLCASLQMYEDVTLGGVLDINRTGWFTRVKVAKSQGNLALATELRANSSGMRVYAISLPKIVPARSPSIPGTIPKVTG